MLIVACFLGLVLGWFACLYNTATTGASRHLHVLSAWFVMYVSHRAEMLQLRTLTGLLGLPVAFGSDQDLVIASAGIASLTGFAWTNRARLVGRRELC